MCAFNFGEGSLQIAFTFATFTLEMCEVRGIIGIFNASE
jgi:hypothetical protein